MKAYNVVIVLAIIIIILFTVYLFLDVFKKKINKKSNNVNKKKVEYNYCPDFFEKIKENGQNYCVNTYNLGSCQFINNRKNFDDTIFTNKISGNKNKCKFAKKCDLSWSGIDRLC